MPRSSGTIFEPVRAPTLRRSGLLIAAAAIAIAGLFVGGEYVVRLITYRMARVNYPRYKPTLFEPMRDIIRNTYHELPHAERRDALLTLGLPIYDLRITPKNLNRLRQTAERVSAQEISEGIPNEYVNAEFLMDGNWVPIEVKLRGLLKQHYSKMMFSMRLNFPKDRLFNGKKQINLSHTYDKGLTIDVTTNWELRRHGVLTWDDAFVVVRMNGDVVGVYQEIEQFGRSMMDGNGRPEGYIFSGYGQLFGKEGAAYDKARAAMDLILPWDKTSKDSRPANCTWTFLQEYFDTDRMAWAAAMVAVLGSEHAWDGDNLRLYWDPAYGQFEPIPWDYSCFGIDPKARPDGESVHEGFALAFCGVPEFRRMRDTRLWSILTERIEPYVEHANRLFDELTPSLKVDVRRPTFAQDKAEHERYIAWLRANRDILTQLFRTHDVRASFWRRGDKRLILQVENRGKAFVKVEAIVLAGTGSQGSSSVALPEPVIVDGVWLGKPGCARFAATVPDGAKPVELVVRNGVTGELLKAGECQLVAGTGSPPIPDAKPEEPKPALAIENVRVDGSTVIWGPGRVELTSTVELPRGYDMVFRPGLDLVLADGASLVGYGALDAVGTVEKPIRVHGSGAEQKWGGLALQGTRVRPVTVTMKHVIVEGGVGTQNNRTYFTSPFAVHGGIVHLQNCQFRNAKTEDGINLKYCQVQLDGNLFYGALSDAVDLDFCNGDVIGNRFEAAGGDGLDVSGARITAAQNFITRCSDKGISIGEASEFLARDNYITHCYAGAAVKDRSTGRILDTGIAHVEIGVAVYVKKPSFGPSKAVVERVAMCDAATAFLRDPSCRIEPISCVRYHSADLPDVTRTLSIETRRVPADLTPGRLQALLSADGTKRCGVTTWDRIPR